MSTLHLDDSNEFIELSSSDEESEQLNSFQLDFFRDLDAPFVNFKEVYNILVNEACF